MHLFSPFEVRGVRARNRVVVSPMWQYAGVNGMPTTTHLVHLGKLAEGGAGIVFQEGTTVDRSGRGTTGDVGLWNDDVIPHYERIVQVIRGAGAVAGVQLIHAGPKARRQPPWEDSSTRPPHAEDWPVLAPSDLPPSGADWASPRAMTLEEIRSTVDAWTQAARRADAAGYEVIDVQAAHGYLLHAFLSDVTNLRTDRYGGSEENRERLLMEVIDGIRSVWPDHKALFVRLSCVDVGWDIERTVSLVERLHARGVDVIDCSTGGLTGRPAPSALPTSYGYQVKYAGEVRRRTGVPTMAVGLVVHPRLAAEIVAGGDADLVALGREFLRNPNWTIDAALELGVDDPYIYAPLRTGHWLRARDRATAHFSPSTTGSPDLRDGES
ncbi:NADH:flavin oxidoreductase/NADH oxidase [Nocardioides sp. 1609]|uniref:NADH:flavin oxidoreductase/NADH oxidase n=1 Tax=Nocardioides sp. 1609 TaxID=2508327 RepID=UPI00107038A3|nr:NADH:flavin oxidoreductase/NADH oxidase [Nocardioides sp. 1609]